MTPNVVLCRAARDDAAGIAGIHMEARTAAMPWLAGVHTPEEVRHYFETVVVPNSEVWVVKTRGALAGFMSLRGNWIDHLYMAPPAWRQGFGRLLVGKAMATRLRLELWTFQRNEGARRFYESFGFEAVEFTDGSANEEREPDVLYVWARNGERA